MSNSIQSVQSTDQQARTDQTVQPPKNSQAKHQPALPQDQVTLSDAAKQGQANNTKPGASGA